MVSAAVLVGVLVFVSVDSQGDLKAARAQLARAERRLDERDETIASVRDELRRSRVALEGASARIGQLEEAIRDLGAEVPLPATTVIVEDRRSPTGPPSVPAPTNTVPPSPTTTTTTAAPPRSCLLGLVCL
jgi:signal transduction histidine kinase